MNKKRMAAIIGAVVALAIVLVVTFVNRRQSSAPPADVVTQSTPTVRSAPTEQEVASMKEAKTIKATIETSKGKIELDLRPDLMPVTVANFVKLAEAGFYDGLKFHRVEDWVIQGGDPQGDGRGGPGYAIKLETSPELKNLRGAVAMARSNHPDSAGSQFYILRRDADWLDGQYAVFGNVTSGLDAVDKMQTNDLMTKITISR